MFPGAQRFCLSRTSAIRRAAYPIAALLFIERPVEFQPIREHYDGLGAAFAFMHCKTDRLRPVREQAAAKVSRVSDHPLAGSILSDEQTRIACACGFDVLPDHDFVSFRRQSPAVCSDGSVA